MLGRQDEWAVLNVIVRRVTINFTVQDWTCIKPDNRYCFCSTVNTVSFNWNKRHMCNDINVCLKVDICCSVKVTKLHVLLLRGGESPNKHQCNCSAQLLLLLSSKTQLYICVVERVMSVIVKIEIGKRQLIL